MDIDKLQQVLRPQDWPSDTAPKNSNALQILKKPSASVIENGVNGLDLIDSPPVCISTITKARAFLQENFGTEYSDEKMGLLFETIREDGWSEERFQRTLKWFLKNKQFATWTIADWFSYGVKLYPYEWTLDKNGDYVAYELPGGVVAYKPRDGQTLPFPEAKFHCLSCDKDFSRSSGHEYHRCVI